MYHNHVKNELMPTGRKTLVNGTTGKPLSVMSSSYTVVQNKDIFNQLDRVLAKSGINLDGAYTTVTQANGGGKVMVEYVFPSTMVDIGNNDTMALKVTAINSFDGSTGFTLSVGAIRFKCLNGVVLGDMMATYSKKHCQGLSIENAAQVVGTGLRVWCENKDTFVAQTKTKVSEETIWACIADMAGFKDKYSATNFNEYMRVVAPTKLRITAVEQYYKVFEQYKKEMGMTQWALNNTLTHISTHGVGKQKPAIATIVSKEKQVGKLLVKYGMACKKAA
jgi:hypothetical protein